MKSTRTPMPADHPPSLPDFDWTIDLPPSWLFLDAPRPAMPATLVGPVSDDDNKIRWVAISAAWSPTRRASTSATDIIASLPQASGAEILRTSRGPVVLYETDHEPVIQAFAVRHRRVITLSTKPGVPTLRKPLRAYLAQIIDTTRAAEPTRAIGSTPSARAAASWSPA
ncbi:hypothetical protein [Nocardia sp. NPDC058497]|uniref:hypothetical protein n=1 Tax=Nocardia sp. NPDC058497 TaxID=3346529 RepID=UPI003656CEB3